MTALRFLPIFVAGFVVAFVRSVGAADERPNFLVIVSDDQRPDTIAALGNPLIETPNLDQLVRRGTTFTRATCAFPLCVPSRAEILTGASAFQNGVPAGIEHRYRPHHSGPLPDHHRT